MPQILHNLLTELQTLPCSILDSRPHRKEPELESQKPRRELFNISLVDKAADLLGRGDEGVVL
jgi:hypothetical protein